MLVLKYSSTAEVELTSRVVAEWLEEFAQRFAVSWTPERFISERASVAPWEAIVIAVALPMPDAAPVIKQTLPSNLLDILLVIDDMSSR